MQIHDRTDVSKGRKFCAMHRAWLCFVANFLRLILMIDYLAYKEAILMPREKQQFLYPLCHEVAFAS